MAPPPSPVPVLKHPSFLSAIARSDLSSRMITHVRVFKAKHALLQGQTSRFPWLVLGHGRGDRAVHRFGHPLPFSAQIGVKKMVSMAWMAQCWNMVQSLFQHLAQSRGKGHGLAGEGELSHCPLPPHQCKSGNSENRSSAPQSSVKRRQCCVCLPVSMHPVIPHHRRNGVSETLQYKEIFVLKLLTNVLQQKPLAARDYCSL